MSPKENAISIAPIKQTESDLLQNPSANTARHIPGVDPDALASATVMIVDDEPSTIDIIQIHLEDAGYRKFVTSSDSTQALDVLREQQPDVVLLDVNMPQVSGLDILAGMRSESALAHIPVIMLTASNSPELRMQALESGATDFLGKPVDASELSLRLRNTLIVKLYQDHLTYNDALTNLPNRRLFLERMNWELVKMERYGRMGAVFNIDLDRFKRINDTLGHSAGDELLKQVGQRLSATVRAVDMIGRINDTESHISLSRLGGDEFTALIPEINKIDDVRVVANRILKAMEKPFAISGQELLITPSIGIAIFPNDGDDPETLLKHSESAMYHCKQHKRNSYEFYSNDINSRSLERLSLEHQLLKALEREELSLHFQPKVDVNTGAITGSEALLRWNHPDIGIVSPLEFIPLAEETGLIVPIGEWVLNEACRQTHNWNRTGNRNINIAVNVSIRQFHEQDFLRTVENALQQSGLDPHYLTLELTENMLMENADDNIKTLHIIKEMGIKISIDDFGTGYSSLSYLQKFPLDELKVDRSFINVIQNPGDKAPIASAIISMAQNLELSTVAEGVELNAQLATLKSLGCDTYQGFLFSKPISADDFLKRVRAEDS